jgi:hypothetical protein
VIRTFASDLATRSISCSSAVTSALRPVSWTCERGRIAPIGLTRELLSATPSIIVHEPFNELPVFQRHPNKCGSNPVPGPCIRPWGNASNLNVCQKRRPCQRKAEAAAGARIEQPRRLQEYACRTDVEYPHAHVGWQVREFIAYLMAWDPSPFLHPAPL